MRQEDRCLPSALGNEPPAAPLEGTHFYRKMRSPSQPALLRGSDKKLYVVKWSDPIHRPHILANEVVGHALLKAVGLPVAPWKPLYASDVFIDANPEMWPQSGLARRRIEPGLHFASEFLGTERTGTVFEWLPTQWRTLLMNADDLLGAYIFDIWTGARNPRKVIFRRQENTCKLRAFFVDNSELFGGRDRQFSTLSSLIPNYSLSLYATEWNEEAVMSWVSKIRIRAPAVLEELSKLVPACWREGNLPLLAEALWIRLESLECMTANELQRVERGYLLRRGCDSSWCERLRPTFPNTASKRLAGGKLRTEIPCKTPFTQPNRTLP